MSASAVFVFFLILFNCWNAHVWSIVIFALAQKTADETRLPGGICLVNNYASREVHGQGI